MIRAFRFRVRVRLTRFLFLVGWFSRVRIYAHRAAQVNSTRALFVGTRRRIHFRRTYPYVRRTYRYRVVRVTHHFPIGAGVIRALRGKEGLSHRIHRRGICTLFYRNRIARFTMGMRVRTYVPIAWNDFPYGRRSIIIDRPRNKTIRVFTIAKRGRV